MRRTSRRLIGMFIATAALAGLIPASAPALTLSGSTAAPADLTAGAHSDFNIHVAVGPSGEDIKDLTISLPPGEVGNPTATPLCDPSQLPNCPSNTAVGSVSSSVTIGSLLPQTISGSVYNLVPQPGEPARFGIVLNALPVTLPPPIGSITLPPTVVQSGTSLRQSDLGLDTVVNDIPKSADVIPGVLSVPIHINSMDLTLDGTIPGSGGKTFMRNPTSCDGHTVGFAADSYTSTEASAQDHFTPTNCGALDFSPSFAAEVGGPGQTASGVPTTASTSIDQDLDEAGLVKAVVAVPNDFNANAALFGNACGQGSFQAGTCPPASVVGQAVAASPLLSQPLSGPVELVSTGGGLPNLGLDLQGQLHLLLQGGIDISKTVTFNGLPDIPIAHFQLTFTPSPGLLGNTRDLCVPPSPLFHADFTGYNGATSSVDTNAIVDGCGAGNGNNGGLAGRCRKHRAKKRKHRAAVGSRQRTRSGATGVGKSHKKRSCRKKHKEKH